MRHFNIGLLFPQTDDEILAIESVEVVHSIVKEIKHIKSLMHDNSMSYTLYYNNENLKAFAKKTQILDNAEYLANSLEQLRKILDKCSRDIAYIKGEFQADCYYGEWRINGVDRVVEAPKLYKILSEREGNEDTKTYILSLLVEDSVERDFVPIIIDAQHKDNLPRLVKIQYCHPASTFIEILDAEIDKRSFSLRDQAKFLRTNYTYRPSHQRIYQNLVTKDYWYYDFYHRENKKHYEVFNSTDYKHVGEADMEGNMIPGTKENDKSIKKYIIGNN